VLPPAGIRQRLADRFALLQSDQWDAPARQHTLRAAIDSSTALLTVEERDHWQQLGVFAGSFDLEAVEAVTATTAATSYRLTASLVRQSLITPVDGGRFRLLESVRAYALEDLERSSRLPAVRDRHAHHLLTFVTGADHGLHGPSQQEWLIRLRATVPDLRAALDWFLGGADPPRGALLAATSTWFWTREGMLDEAARWMETAKAVPVDDAAVRAAVLHGWGRISAPLGKLAAARDACQESVALSRDLADDAALARALVTLGLCEWAQGDLRSAAGSHDEAAARAEAAADRWHRDVALVLRLRTAIDAGEPHVEDRLERVLSQLRGNGDPHVVGLALGQRARLGALSDDANRARTTAEAALVHWRTTGYREGELQALNLLSRANVRTGQLDQATDDAHTAVLTAATLGHRGALFEGLETLAAVHHAAGRDHEAHELLTLAHRERAAAQIPVPAGDRDTISELHRAVADRVRAVGTAASPRGLDQLIADLRART
jgi:predicted ATPase